MAAFFLTMALLCAFGGGTVVGREYQSWFITSEVEGRSARLVGLYLLATISCLIARAYT